MKKISATIITLNEEDKIRQCLESLQGVADEIVVVDSLSTDNTKSICEEFGVRFIEQKWLGYSEQKNLANDIASHDWILSIDADEVLSDELKKSILKIKNEERETKNEEFVYSFNRLNNYCGKWIHHSGFYPDKKIRIWNRKVGKWEGIVHEVIKFSTKVNEVHLKGDLLHYSFDTHEDFKNQLFKFAEMKGKEYFHIGKKNVTLLSVLSPFFSFVRNYFFKRGFLDGKDGYKICLEYALATRYKYETLRKQRKSSGSCIANPNVDSKIIAFDGKRIVRNSTGLGNYCRTLINDMISCNINDNELLLYCPDKGRDELRNQIIESDKIRFVFPDKKKGRIYKCIWRTNIIVKQLINDNVQIYHGLSGELPLGLKKNNIKGVVTIHDLIFLRHPEYYRWFDRKIYTWKFHQALKQADHIIAISECTKRDIIEFGKISPEKISVVYQSCSPRFSESPELQDIENTIRKYNLPDIYLLCVGTIEERKNLMLAVKSLAELPDNIHLVAVGRQTKYARKIEKESKSLGVSHRLHLLSGVSDTELNVVYKKASLFVYPSRYEGFGIPVIEAIFSGLPVVTCSGSCLEEAGGPHCFYVDPDDVEGMIQAIKHLISDKTERDERIKLSREYVQKFNGTDIVVRIFGIYKELCN